MKITTIRRVSYAGAYIYILQINYAFMYLFSFQGQIYMQHVMVRPRWWRVIGEKLHIIESAYTKADIDGCIQAMMSGAVTSLEELRKKFKKRYTTAKIPVGK